MSEAMSELAVGFVGFLAKLAPHLLDLYKQTNGNTRQAIAILKRGYQAADAAQVNEFYGRKAGR